MAISNGEGLDLNGIARAGEQYLRLTQGIPNQVAAMQLLILHDLGIRPPDKFIAEHGLAASPAHMEAKRVAWAAARERLGIDEPGVIQ